MVRWPSVSEFLAGGYWCEFCPTQEAKDSNIESTLRHLCVKDAYCNCGADFNAARLSELACLETFANPRSFTTKQVDVALDKQKIAAEGSLLHALTVFPRGRQFLTHIQAINEERRDSNEQAQQWDFELCSAEAFMRSDLIVGGLGGDGNAKEVVEAIAQCVVKLDSFLATAKQLMIQETSSCTRARVQRIMAESTTTLVTGAFDCWREVISEGSGYPAAEQDQKLDAVVLALSQVASSKQFSSEEWVPQFKKEVQVPLESAQRLIKNTKSFFDESSDTLAKLNAAQNVNGAMVESLQAILGEKAELHAEFVKSNHWKALVATVVEGSAKEVTPQLTDFLTLFEPVRMFCPCIEKPPNMDDYVKQLKSLCDVPIPKVAELAKVLVDYATGIDDQRLACQVNTLLSIANLTCATAKLQHVLASSKSRDDVRPADQGPCFEKLRDLRSSVKVHNQVFDIIGKKFELATLFETMEGQGCESDPRTSVERAFKKDQDGHDVVTLCKDAAAKCLELARQSWVNDFAEATRALQETIPDGWEVFGDKLLENADAMNLLVGNPSYTKIGPFSNLIKEMRKGNKALVRDGCGPFVPHDVYMEAKKAEDRGTTTVATTFVAYQLKHVIPSVAEGSQKTQVQALLTALKAKGCSFSLLCESLKAAIKVYIPDVEERE